MLTNEERIQKFVALQTLFPECVFERRYPDGRIDYDLDLDRLLEELEVKESYRFEWVGKRAARNEVFTPTAKQLAPDLAGSRNWSETQNVLVEGDNLDALKLLQRDYLGKVDLIYIDPPYNTGSNTFVYNDDFSVSLPEGADSHSHWCSTLFSRLILSRSLLAEDGAIFVSIDDCEYANAVKLLDEVYGRKNFVASIVWESKREAKGIPPKTMCVKNHEYILCYSKNGEYRFIGEPRNVEDGFSNPDGDPRGPWKRQYLQRFGLGFPQRTIFEPSTGRAFTFETPYTQEKLERWIAEGRVIFPTGRNKYPARKEFFYEYKNPFKPIVTSWGLFSTKVGSEQLKSLFDEKKVFDYSKPVELLSTLLRRAMRSDALVLDFFAGSGTLGHAVMALNAEDGGTRRFILVQSAESCGKKSVAHKQGYQTISSICKERLRRAGDLIEQVGATSVDIGFRLYKIE